jgi:hypothetical protein
MEKDPIKNDKRRARRERNFGGEKSCGFCGHTQGDVLEQIEPEKFLEMIEKARSGLPIILCKSHVNALVGKSVVEAHHVATHANLPTLTFPLCGNHHAIESEAQRVAGIEMRRRHTLLERCVSIFYAWVQFLRSWTDALIELAELLIKLIKGLDDRCPEWRELEEAK